VNLQIYNRLPDHSIHQEAMEPCLETGGVGKESGRQVPEPVLVECERAENPEAGEGPGVKRGYLVVSHQQDVQVGKQGQGLGRQCGQSAHCKSLVLIYSIQYLFTKPTYESTVIFVSLQCAMYFLDWKKISVTIEESAFYYFF
jgi:hypothetical protein